MNRQPTRCVVFDLDDTLYLERDYVRSGFAAVGRHVEEHLALATFASRAWARFCGGLRSRIFDTVLLELGHQPAPGLVQALVAVYRSHRPAIVLEPDALTALDALHGSLKLAILTDGAAESQRAKLEALGLARWTQHVVVTAEHAPEFAKPSPAGFRLIEDLLSVSGPECLYVGDNPAKDFAGPRSLGWRTLRIRRDGSLHEQVPTGLPQCQDVPDLRALVQTIRKPVVAS